MHRTRPGGLNGGEMYGTRAGLPILLLLTCNVWNNRVSPILHRFRDMADYRSNFRCLQGVLLFNALLGDETLTQDRKIWPQNTRNNPLLYVPIVYKSIVRKKEYSKLIQEAASLARTLDHCLVMRKDAQTLRLLRRARLRGVKLLPSRASTLQMSFAQTSRYRRTVTQSTNAY